MLVSGTLEWQLLSRCASAMKVECFANWLQHLILKIAWNAKYKIPQSAVEAAFRLQ